MRVPSLVSIIALAISLQSSVAIAQWKCPVSGGWFDGVGPPCDHTNWGPEACCGDPSDACNLSCIPNGFGQIANFGHAATYQVSLSQDVVLSGTNWYDGCQVTLDLLGHTLSLEGGLFPLRVNHGSALTISDGTVSVCCGGASIGGDESSGTIRVSAQGVFSAPVNLSIGGNTADVHGALIVEDGGAVTTGHVSLANSSLLQVMGAGSSATVAGQVVATLPPSTIQVGEGATLNAAILLNPGSDLSIEGQITGDVTNPGASSVRSGSVIRVAGDSIGTLTVQGNYAQPQANFPAKLAIQLGGTNPASQYDVVTVSGSASIAGMLVVTLSNGFQPSVGQAFQVLSAGSLRGAFQSLQFPSVPGVHLTVQYDSTSVTLLAHKPGDVNGDGVRNVDDLLAVINDWGPCPAGACPGDVAPLNGNGVVNVDDLLMVINNWG